MKSRFLLVLSLLALSSITNAQISQTDPEYLEQLYGPIIDVGLSELAFNPESYNGRGIRVKGRVSILGITGEAFELNDGGARLIAIPIRRGMNEEEITRLSGQTIEITGVFNSRSASSGQSSQGSQVSGSAGTVQFWSWVGPPEKVNKNQAQIVTLEQLVTRAGKMDGQLVRVVGKFRGRNLFADLPARSLRTASDWIIKDSLFAVWVTNRKPKGDGFELDPSMRRDTDRWVEVVGRPNTRRGVVVIDAAEVSLTAPPTPTATAAAAPPPPERVKVPPVIVFSLPLDGESDFDFSGRIMVQFNNDMDEESFVGRVGLRYAGPVRPGDPGFQSMRVTYQAGNKALVVDPGVPIMPGRVLDLVLLTGIVDIDGQPLVRRDGRPPQKDIAEMLRFK